MQVAVIEDGDGHSASAGCETGLSLFNLDAAGAKVRASLRRQEAMQGRPSPRRLPNRGAVGRVPVGTAHGDGHVPRLPRRVWRMQAAVLRCQRAGRAEPWFRWAKILALPGSGTAVVETGSAPKHYWRASGRFELLREEFRRTWFGNVLGGRQMEMAFCNRRSIWMMPGGDWRR